MFARVVRSEDCVAVGVLDLTGSAHGSWSGRTAPGRCRSVRVRLLLDGPERWRAGVAALGPVGGGEPAGAARPAPLIRT